MNIVKATKKYEDWVGQQTALIRSDLELKHQAMTSAVFHFLRATFYRWVQVWPEVAADLNRAPHVLGVGDLHVENFGTWRDCDGRLVWGVNDFDEACQFPYTMDLVRLVTSALLGSQGKQFKVRLKDAAAAVLEGYRESLEDGGQPFVLGERHVWLRQIAESDLRDPVRFWQKIDSLPTVQGNIPESAREALEYLLPEGGLKYRVARRVAGLGSLGRMRFVAVTEWKGGRVAREAKVLVPSSAHWLNPEQTPGEILYTAILQRAVRCPDPFFQLRGHWIVRRVSPHCSRIELESLGRNKFELELLEAMGRETANVHLGSASQRKAIRKDVRSRKANWLAASAQSMARVVERDWREWNGIWKQKKIPASAKVQWPACRVHAIPSCPGHHIGRSGHVSAPQAIRSMLW